MTLEKIECKCWKVNTQQQERERHSSREHLLIIKARGPCQVNSEGMKEWKPCKHRCCIESSKQSVREPIQWQGIFLLISILSLSTFVSVCVYLCFSGSFLLCVFSLSFSLIKSYCNSGNVDTFYTFWKIECLSKVYETPFKFQ